MFVPALPSTNEEYFAGFKSKAVAQVHDMPTTKAVFEAKLLDGVKTPSPGFPSLTSAPITSLWRRRIGADIHGSRSRYRTAMLVTGDKIPLLPPLEALASTLIGTIVFINYPFLMEGYVTALSDIDMTIRGHEAPHYHSHKGREVWHHTMTALSTRLENGEGVPGTGGWMVPNRPTTICVRPLKGITTLEDGTRAKVYAKFEVTLPFMAALWSPLAHDPRTENLPMALESDPFFSKSQGEGFDSYVLPPAGPEADYAGMARTLTERGSPRISDPFVSPTKLLPAMGSESESFLSNSIIPPSRSTNTATTTRTFATSSIRRSRLPPGTPQTSRSFQTMTRHPSLPMSRVQVVRGRGGGLVGLGVAGLVFLGGMVGGTHGSPMTLQSHSTILMGHPAVDACQPITTSTPPLKFEHGTTTLSFSFQHGIVAAVDSRASLGNFVGSKTVQKVLPISSHMLGTMAGGAADCSAWIRKLKAEAELFELMNSHDGYHHRMSVTRASRLLSNALYENRGSGLSVGTMIMGFDLDGGPRIFYVDDSGARIEGDMFSVGSGSTFALGILDRERRFDMTQEEAIALGIKAIRHATFRDAYSGGFINVFLITKKDGWKKVFSEDIAGSVGMDHGEVAETISAQQVLQDSEQSWEL